jgi:hypothetical protein
MLLKENEGTYEVQGSLLFTFSSVIILRDLLNCSLIGTVTINFPTDETWY